MSSTKPGWPVDGQRRKFLQRGGDWPGQMAWIRHLKSLLAQFRGEFQQLTVKFLYPRTNTS